MLCGVLRNFRPKNDWIVRKNVVLAISKCMQKPALTTQLKSIRFFSISKNGNDG